MMFVAGKTVAGAKTAPELAWLRARRAEIVRVASAHGASVVGVFGSVARGTARPESDIDLLVNFEPGRTLADHVTLWRDLQALFGRRVDVLSGGGLTDRDDDIRTEVVTL